MWQHYYLLLFQLWQLEILQNHETSVEWSAGICKTAIGIDLSGLCLGSWVQLWSHSEKQIALNSLQPLTWWKLNTPGGHSGHAMLTLANTRLVSVSCNLTQVRRCPGTKPSHGSPSEGWWAARALRVTPTSVLGLPQSIEIDNMPVKKFRQGFTGAPEVTGGRENK